MRSIQIAFLLLLSPIFNSPVHAHNQAPHQQQYTGHVSVFFEIPVTNMARAKKFYETILTTTLSMQSAEQIEMAFFPAPAGKTSGALVKGEGMLPSADGAIVYLNGGHNLSAILDRVVPAGGIVLVSKTQIERVGYFALFKDTEGNRLGLFSAN